MGLLWAKVVLLAGKTWISCSVYEKKSIELTLLYLDSELESYLWGEACILSFVI